MPPSSIACRALPRALSIHRRPPATQFVRRNSSHQPTDSPIVKSNPHRQFYKEFGRPFSKVFLGALFTYQVIYWSWLKLESMEEKQTKEDEIQSLEGQLRTLRENKIPRR